ncbi:hypothetical protein N0V83_000840 [Neocucurbitaria cava]|uniref:Uncharacterized protein n=1 Tax=Neocucurbitaria cava TaxID=798079 RepID=A0A9W8YH56_9PLEO|nr:hypothetical protein N0V83_000840 [Neocucurbitaria cava]
MEQAQMKPLISRLQQSQNHAFQPELAPICILDLAVIRLRTFCYDTYSDFLPIREAMHTNLYYSPAQDFQLPELTDMPRKLTALINAAAGSTGAIQGTLEILQSLDRRLQETQQQQQSQSDELVVVVEMRDYLAFLQQTLEGTRRKNEYLKESVQGIVQMVYAVLQQKDNELNLRYGADMRMVAVVTLLFLPGTFVATLFSASW